MGAGGLEPQPSQLEVVIGPKFKSADELVVHQHDSHVVVVLEKIERRMVDRLNIRRAR